jgi:hypothetical protein
MRLLWDQFNSIKSIQPRQNTRAENKSGGDKVKKSKTCVECKGHKEGYMSYYCEKCYREILSEKVRAEDEKHSTKRDK